MISDPALYLPLLIAGAFAAAFVIGAVGFADALILNAVWLHIMEPAAAIPLVVMCGVAMHIVPLYKLRNTLDFSKLKPFIVGGVVGVPFGALALQYVAPEMFRYSIGALLIMYGGWMLVRSQTSVGTYGGARLDGIVGTAGGFMGGFAGLSGLFPTLWTGLRGWPRDTQRGAFQPFVLFMHGLGVLIFTTNGFVTEQIVSDFFWCIPAIIIGSWAGVLIYPFINEQVFKRIILGLILVSGITLLL